MLGISTILSLDLIHFQNEKIDSAVMRVIGSESPLMVNYDDELLSEDNPSVSSLTDRPHIEPPGIRHVLLHDPRDIISSTSHYDSEGSTTTVISRSLTSDPERLQSFLSNQTRLRPSPWVRLVGTHTETREKKRRNANEKKEKETTMVTDFDISISASDLLIPAWRRTRVIGNEILAYRGGRSKSVATGLQSDVESTHTSPTLEEWCHRFCASRARLKTFTLTRRVINHDKQYLKDTLHGILRSTDYRGHIQVTFPLDERAVVVMSDHPFNRYRMNSFIWWGCVISQLWIITWPILWIMTKRWEVVNVDWPCKIYQRSDGGWPNSDEANPELIHQGFDLAQLGIRGARVGVMTEGAWVKGWRQVIMRAAKSRTQGTLYSSDRDLSRAMEPRNAERGWKMHQQIRITDIQAVLDSAFELVHTVNRISQVASGWGGDTVTIEKNQTEDEVFLQQDRCQIEVLHCKTTVRDNIGGH